MKLTLFQHMLYEKLRRGSPQRISELHYTLYGSGEISSRRMHQRVSAHLSRLNKKLPAHRKIVTVPGEQSYRLSYVIG